MLSSQQTELDRCRAVAVIPARGGSKGIPRKNLKVAGGLSLVARAVETCLAARSLAEVYVSTEDQEIAREAHGSGARVITRPPLLATDHAPTADVLRHSLEHVSPMPEILVLVQCTAPLLTPADVDGTVQRLLETEADVAVAVAPCNDWLVREGYCGRLRGVGWDLPDQITRRQDGPETWVIAGSAWAINARRFIDRGYRVWGDNCVAYHAAQKLDVDTPDDLEVARAVLEKRQRERIVYPL